MEGLPLFLVALSVREVLSLPETKEACACILADPALSILTEEQAFLLGNLLFQKEILLKEFILSWLLRVCQSLKNISPLGLAFQNASDSSGHAVYNVTLGNVFCASFSVFDGLRNAGFGNLHAESTTEDAITRALDAAKRIPGCVASNNQESSSEEVTTLLILKLEDVLRGMLDTPSTLVRRNMVPLIQVLARDRRAKADDNLLEQCMLKDISEQGSRPVLCPALWSFSKNETEERDLALWTLRQVLNGPRPVNADPLVFLLEDALSRSIPVWDEQGQEIVEALLSVENMAYDTSLAKQVLVALRHLLATAKASQDHSKLPPELYLKLMDLVESLSHHMILKDVVRALANVIFGEASLDIVDVEAFVSRSLVEIGGPNRRGRMQSLVTFVLGLPTDKQIWAIEALFRHTLQALSDMSDKEDSMVFDRKWCLLHLPALYYRLPDDNRKALLVQLRAIIEGTPWDEHSPLKIRRSLPTLLLLYFFPSMNPDETPPQLLSMESVDELDEISLTMSQPLLKRSVGLGILKDLSQCGCPEMNEGIRPISDADIVVYRLFLSSGIEPVFDVSIGLEDISFSAIVYECMKSHTTGLGSNFASLLRQIARPHVPQPSLVLRFACAVTTCTRICSELDKQSLSPDERRSTWEALGSVIEECYRYYIHAEAERWARKCKRSVEECLPIVSSTTLRMKPRGTRQMLKLVFGFAEEDDDEQAMDSEDDDDDDGDDGNDDEDDEDDDEGEDMTTDYGTDDVRITRGWMLTLGEDSITLTSIAYRVFKSLAKCLKELQEQIGSNDETKTIKGHIDTIVAKVAREPALRRLFRFYNFADDAVKSRALSEERERFMNMFGPSVEVAKAAFEMPDLVRCLTALLREVRGGDTIPVVHHLNVLFALVSVVTFERERALLAMMKALTLLLIADESTHKTVEQFFAENANEFDFANYFRYCAQAVALDPDLAEDFVQFLVTFLSFDEVLGTVMSFSWFLVSDYPKSTPRIILALLACCESDHDRTRLFNFALEILMMVVDVQQQVSATKKRELAVPLVRLLEAMAFENADEAANTLARLEEDSDEDDDDNDDDSHISLTLWLNEYRSRQPGPPRETPANQGNTNHSESDASKSRTENGEDADPERSRRRARLSAVFSSMIEERAAERREADGRRLALGSRLSRRITGEEPPPSLRLLTGVDRPPEVFLDLRDVNDEEDDDDDEDDDEVHDKPLDDDDPPDLEGLMVIESEEEEVLSSDSEKSPTFAQFFGTGARLPQTQSIRKRLQSSLTLKRDEVIDLALDDLGEEESFPMRPDEVNSIRDEDPSTSPKASVESSLRSSSLVERVLHRRGLASLLPGNQRCFGGGSATQSKSMFRCRTCSSSATTMWVCSACANACHVKHDLYFEGTIRAECVCVASKCRARIARRRGSMSNDLNMAALVSDKGESGTAGDRPTPQARKLPKLPHDFLKETLSDPANLSILAAAYELLMSEPNAEQTDVRNETAFESITPSLAASGFSEHNFDMWKGVDGSKHIIDVINKYSLPQRRLAAGRHYLAIAEGCHVTLINPASHLCMFQSEFIGANSQLTSALPSSLVDRAVSSLKVDPLDSIDVGFAVLQMEFNAANPNLLLIAGLSQCVVLLLTNTGKLLKNIPLVFTAELPDVIRKVQWIPNSRSELCIVTGCRVKTFDLFRSARPVHSYKLAEEIAALVDATFLPVSASADPHKRILLLLSSSGCLLRQDLTLGDETEELLICEFLSTPSEKGRTATALTPVSPTELLMHFAQGSLAHVTLSPDMMQIVNHFLIEDDEPGSGRAGGTCLVVEGRYLFTAAHRQLRQQGSLVFFEFANNSAKTISTMVCGPPPHGAFGRLVGAVVWGGDHDPMQRRVIALHDNGTVVVCRRGGLHADRLVYSDAAEKGRTGHFIRRPSPLMFEKLKMLVPSSRYADVKPSSPSSAASTPLKTVQHSAAPPPQQPPQPSPSGEANKTPSSSATKPHSSLPNVPMPVWHEFGSIAMYHSGLIFSARQGYIRQVALPSSSSAVNRGNTSAAAPNRTGSGGGNTNNEVTTTPQVATVMLHKEAELKAAMERLNPSCFVGDSNALDFCIFFASQSHSIAGLKLHFGAHNIADSVPTSLKVLDREIPVSRRHGMVPHKGTSGSASSPVVVQVLFTREEAKHLARVGGLRVRLIKSSAMSETTSTPHLAIDGVEVFVTESARLDFLYDEYEFEEGDSQREEANETKALGKNAEMACARLIAGGRASGLWFTTTENGGTTPAAALVDLNDAHVLKRAEFFRKLRNENPDLFLRMSAVLFPDPYERLKVADMVSVSKLVDVDREQDYWSLVELRQLGRAAIRCPRMVELSIQGQGATVMTRLEASVKRLLQSPQEVNALDVMTSAAAIGLLCCRTFGRAGGEDEYSKQFTYWCSGLFHDDSVGYAVMDGLLSAMLYRPDLVRSELQWGSEDPETDVVQFQCDCCYTMPIRHSRWTCKTCEDFDLCETCFLAAGFDHIAQHEFMEIKLDRENFNMASCCKRCGELKATSLPISAASKTEYCLTCIDMGYVGEVEGNNKDEARDAEMSTTTMFSGDVSYTARDLVLALMEAQEGQYSVTMIKFLVYLSGCYALIRFNQSSILAERVLHLVGKDLLFKARSKSSEECLAMNLLEFTARAFSSLPSVTKLPSMQELVNHAERRLVDIALNTLNDTPAVDATGSKSLVGVKAAKRGPLPSWLGAMDPFQAQLIWQGVAWGPMAYFTTCTSWNDPASAAAVDIFTLDKAWAVDPFHGWESGVVGVINAAEALSSGTWGSTSSSSGQHSGKKRGSETVQENSSSLLSQWQTVYCRYVTRTSLTKPLAVLHTLLKAKGMKTSLADLLRTSVFRSSMADFKHVCDRISNNVNDTQDSSATKRDAVYSLAITLSRLKRTVTKSSSVEAWVKFCLEETQSAAAESSSSKEDPFRLLIRVASFLNEFDLNPSLALGLILRGVGADKDGCEIIFNAVPDASAVGHLNNLTKEDLTLCFDWLVSGGSTIRFNSLRLLLVWFRDHVFGGLRSGGSEDEGIKSWAMQTLTERALPPIKSVVGRNVRRVEVLTLFALVKHRAIKAGLFKNSKDDKRLLIRAMDVFASSLERLKGMPLVRSCSRSELEMLSTTLKASVPPSTSAASASAKSSSAVADASATVGNNHKATIKDESVTTTRKSQQTSQQQQENNKVNAFSLLFSPPCLTCGFLDRPFLTQSLEYLRCQVTYMPSTIVMRLARLHDIRAIALDLQPIRRGLANIIESVIVSTSSAYLPSSPGGGGLDLAALALDSSQWEQAAVLTNFEAPSSSSAAAASSSSTSSSSTLAASRIMYAALGGSSSSRSDRLYMGGGGGASSSATNGNGQPTKLSSTAFLFPMVSATLIKFDFVLIKERTEADRMLCPRCSKPVTNDHGVCSNCSEMVYQCRQCRNINYEDLRSFLCVQCGFCRYARFSFRADARPSTFYPEIRTEKELENARRLMVNNVAKEEHTALTDLEMIRQTLFAKLEEGNSAEVQQELAKASIPGATSSGLRNAFNQAYLSSADADALRKRIAAFRKDGPPPSSSSLVRKRGVEDHMLGRVDDADMDECRKAVTLCMCFVCSYSFSLAIASVVSTLVLSLNNRDEDEDIGGDDGMNELRSRISMLHSWREVQTVLEGIASIACLPKALASTEQFLPDPLVALVVTRPDVALKPVTDEVMLALDTAVRLPMAIEMGEEAADLVEAILSFSALSESSNKASLVKAMVQVLSRPLDAVAALVDGPMKGKPLRPETERLALKCLIILNETNDRSGEGKWKRKRTARSSPLSEASQPSQSFKRMRASSFEI